MKSYSKVIYIFNFYTIPKKNRNQHANFKTKGSDVRFLID